MGIIVPLIMYACVPVNSVPGAGLLKVSVLEAAATTETEKIKTKAMGMENRRTVVLLPRWSVSFM